MAENRAKWEGNCYYAGGGVFRAFVYEEKWDQETRKTVRIRKVCDDPLALDIIRQLFELLVSSDTKRVVGDFVVQKLIRENAPPMVGMKVGADTYELTLSARGTGAARLVVWGPFDTQDETIDVQEVTEMLEEEEG
jgi:hypothetical protein